MASRTVARTRLRAAEWDDTSRGLRRARHKDGFERVHAHLLATSRGGGGRVCLLEDVARVPAVKTTQYGRGGSLHVDTHHRWAHLHTRGTYQAALESGGAAQSEERGCCSTHHPLASPMSSVSTETAHTEHPASHANNPQPPARRRWRACFSKASLQPPCSLIRAERGADRELSVPIA